ncbi:hypothetical protein [Kitasatospora sp. NPDC058190]|uniref:hypothetical protein n=1 Tax=Kitasatospora sp. NPDC058190 TaxID=3346371 RepID=UPI0036DE00B3
MLDATDTAGHSVLLVNKCAGLPQEVRFRARIWSNSDQSRLLAAVGVEVFLEGLAGLGVPLPAGP